jgi:hypothetical protein
VTTAVDNLTWEAMEGGKTVVTLWGNGPFSLAATARLRLEDPPREVIIVRGLSPPLLAAELTVRSPALTVVRVGYAPHEPYGELILVFDLSKPGVTIETVSFDKSRLVITLAERR